MARRAKSSADYWREREAEQRRHDITDRMAYNREVRRIYQSMQDNIQKEIDAFYGKYAKKEGITLAEAKRRVSRLEMEEYERKAARYVKEKNFSKQANEEMRLYNLTMKVNRLEMLKANIGLELTRGFDELDKTCGEKLTRHATKEFERLAGILSDTVRDNARYVHAIVNASFHNATFSDRIWTYQAALKASLDTQIQRGLIQGRNSMELARAIGREFEVSRRDAERLMITEMRRVRTEVAKQSYEENGNREYQFLALGARPCDKCLDIDGQVFPVKEMMPGVNAPPIHPRCECTTAPYWDEAKFQEWLDSGAAADGVPFGEFEEGQNPVANGADSGIIKETERFGLSEQSRSNPGPINSTLVSEDVEGNGFRDRIRMLGENRRISDIMTYQSRITLWRRNGTKHEDLIFIDPETGKCLAQRNYNEEGKCIPTEKMKEMAEKKPRTIIALHNHPRNMLPSYADLKEAKRYKYGVVLCHNGAIIKYSVAEDADISAADFLLNSAQRLFSKGESLDIIIEDIRKKGVAMEVFI